MKQAHSGTNGVSSPRLRRAGRAGLRTLRQQGPRALAVKVSRVALERLNALEVRLPLPPDDIAQSSGLQLPVPRERVPRGRPLRVGWVCEPGEPGSGGHTTMFRMIEALERAGHQCHVFLYRSAPGDLARHEAVLRAAWPNATPVVHDAYSGIGDVDVVLATSWQSAHVLATHGRAPMRRAYFIQDYEPYFHPWGWEYALAEDSYRFGFRCISLGPMIGALLEKELGVASDVLDFGVDTTKYHLTNEGPRSGVAFFARPGIARRGYELGIAALKEFHARHPEEPIHVFPDRRGVDFPVVRHGHLSPTDLNQLYNSVVAGVALSYTNVSLVPEEMLASGAVPVCNESMLARACLDNQHVEWVPSTPSAIADRLGDVLDRHRLGLVTPATVAASVEGRGWRLAQDQLVRVVEEEGYGPVGRPADLIDGELTTPRAPSPR